MMNRERGSPSCEKSTLPRPGSRKGQVREGTGGRVKNMRHTSGSGRNIKRHACQIEKERARRCPEWD